jgi:uncharacterized DUF497 family protein
MIAVDQLDWDDWNIEHISRHGVTREDVENACHRVPILFKQSYNNRLVILGPAPDSRNLAVAIGRVPGVSKGLYYVFTARPADRAERRFYHRVKGGPTK